MTRRAVVIGATGQIGWATVPALIDDGWDVTAIQRNPAAVPPDWPDRGVTIVPADRSDGDQLRAAMGDGLGADLGGPELELAAGDIMERQVRRDLGQLNREERR